MTDFSNFAKWAERQDPRNIDWTRVKADFPDYNIGGLESDFLERFGLSRAVGLRKISKEEFERKGAPQITPISEEDRRLESLKIGGIADLATEAMPSTTVARPRFAGTPPTLDPSKLLTELPTPEGIAEPSTTARPIMATPLEQRRALAPAKIGEPRPTEPLTEKEVAKIQSDLERNRKSGEQKFADIMGWLPKKFTEFGTEQIESLGLLAQLATSPEVEVEGQKIPTHEVVAKLPASIGQHYLGYLKDPIGKIVDDPFAALVDAYIVKQVFTGLTGAAKSLARKPKVSMVAQKPTIGEAPTVIKPISEPPGAFPMRAKRAIEQPSIGEPPLEFKPLGDKAIFGSKKTLAAKATPEFWAWYDSIGGKSGAAELGYKVRKGSIQGEWWVYKYQPPKPKLVAPPKAEKPQKIKLTPEQEKGIAALDEVSAELYKQKEAALPTQQKAIDTQIRDIGRQKQLILSGEAGQAIIPTSTDLTRAGQELSKLNIYTKYAGEPLYDALRRVGRKVVPEKLQRFFLEKYGQPPEYVMMAQRELTDAGLRAQEGVQWATEASGRVLPIRKPDILKAVTDPERLGLQSVRGTTIEPIVGKMQADMTRLGQEAVNLGLVGEESFAFFLDRYLPKLHKSKLIPTSFRAAKMKFSGRIQRRGTIRDVPMEELAEWETKGWEIFKDKGGGTLQIRKFEPYGDIQDPFTLYAKGVSDLEHDIGLARILKNVSENKNWVSDVPKEGWVKIGEKKAIQDRFSKIGNIRDKYIHPEIARDLTELIATRSEWRKFFDGMTSLWKVGKTAYNPATHVRNIVSNAVLADMGGLSPRRIDIYLNALKQLSTKSGRYFKEAQTSGLFGKEFYQAEVKEMLSLAEKSKNPISFFGRLLKNKYAESPARLYQAEEQMFKLAKFIQNRQKGMGVAESVADGHKWLFDYTTVSPFVGLGRRTVFPFITFQAKAFPRIIETAIKHPLRVTKYFAAMYAMERYSRAKLGLTEEQYQKIRQNAPEYIRKGQMWVLLPEKDQHGNFQFFNLTYFMPWGDIISSGRGSGLPEPLSNLLVPSHPILRLPFEIKMNRSIFTDRDIWKPEESPWKKSIQYAAETMFPPTMPLVGYHAEKVRKRALGIPGYFGEKERPAHTLLGVMGARPVPVNIPRTVKFDLIGNAKKIKELRSRILSTRLNQSLSKTEKDKRMRDIGEKILQLQQERREKISALR